MGNLYTRCFPIDFCAPSFQHAVSQNWTGGSSLTHWIIVALLLLVGCNKEDAPSAAAVPLPELTIEQQKAVSSLNKMYLSTQSLASWGSKDVFRQMDAGFVVATNDLKECEFDSSRPESNALPTNGYFYSVIDGDQCPVLISHRTGYRVSDFSGLGHVDVSLEYRQQNASKPAALLSYEINGRLELRKAQQQTAIWGQLQGQLQTLNWQTVPVYFQISLRDARLASYQSTQSVRLEFPDFVVVAEAIRNRNIDKNEQLFKINGREASPALFEQLVGAFLPTQGPFSF